MTPIPSVLDSAVAAHRAGRLDEAEALYRSALAVEAQHPEALHLLGLVRFQAGDAAAGTALIRRALALLPGAAPFLENLGVVLWTAGQGRAALAVARRGLGLGPSAVLLGIAGQALVAAGDPAGALSAFAALAASGSATARLDMAFCLRRLGRRAESERVYRELAAAADDPRPLAALAEMAAEMARHSDAIAGWRRAAALAPGDPTLLLGLGNSLFGLDLPVPAIAAFGRALAGSAGDADAQLTSSAFMGRAGARQRHREEGRARTDMRRALAILPEAAAGWRNASELARKDGGEATALGFADRALAIDRNDPTAHGNRGLALAATDDLHGARAAFRRAVCLDPTDPRHLSNLADPLHQAGAFRDMRTVLERALALAPAFAPAAYMLGIAHMLLGDPAAAWRYYEHRFSPPAVVRRRPFPQPWWDGRALPGRLLVWGEQGVGDEMLFGSMLPDLAARGIAVVLEIDSRLVSAFARSFPSFEVLARTDPPDPRLLAPDVAAQIAMGSLARFLRPTIASFGTARGFLVPDDRRRAEARAWLATLGPGLKVGIAWRSSRRDIVARRLHTELAEWSPILATGGVHFVNLQYGDCEAELAAAERDCGIRIHRAPGIDLFADLEGVLALAASLDLSVSTITTAYVPGAAAGTEAWLLLPRIHHEALGQDRAPWLPSVRGFMRGAGESWQRTIRAVADALARRGAECAGG